MCCDFDTVVLQGNQIEEQLAGLVLLFYTHFFLADFHHGTLKPIGFFFKFSEVTLYKIPGLEFVK